MYHEVTHKERQAQIARRVAAVVVVIALAVALGWYIGFRFDLLSSGGVVRMSLWNAATILIRRI